MLERAFRLLESFAADEESVGLSTLAERSSLPRPTAYRLLSQLTEVGAVARDGRKYRPGRRLFELGSLVPELRQLRALTQQSERDLFEITHETVHIGLPSGTEVLYLDKMSGDGAYIPTLVGMRKPLYCTGLGKAILSASPPEVLRETIGGGLRKFTRYTITSEQQLQREIDETRRRGVAFDRGEYCVGVQCVAAPVVDSAGSVVLAISVAGPSVPRFDIERLADQVRRAARNIAALLATSARAPDAALR